ncbi:MAG: GldG family protein [Dehalococcoidales bacterium]
MQSPSARSNKGISGLTSVLGLLALLIGLVLTVLLPAIRLAGWMIMALGVLLLGVAFIIDYRKVGKAITGKRGLFSTGTTVMVSIFIGITILINAISINNYARFDITGLSQFTLTSQTKDVLNQLDEPMQISIFTVPGDPFGDAISTFIEEYENYTEQIKLKTIDPDEFPDQARRFAIDIYPTVVFQSRNNIRVVMPQEIFIQTPDGQVASQMEHPFTSAILEVSGIIQKKIYFLTGHGESSVNDDYGAAAQSLLENLYKVAILDLQMTPRIPSDATALIIAGPESPPTSAESAIIADYLENNGWLMIMLNPGSPPEYARILSEWGVNVQDGTIIDPSSFVSPNVDTPLILGIRNMLGFEKGYFPGATAIIPQEEAPELLIIQPLFYTSKESWLEEDFDSEGESQFDEGTDTIGPLAIGVLIAGVTEADASDVPPEAEDITRIVIVGDSDFASTRFFNGDNGNMFLNMVELLTTGKELISIERKVLPFRRLIVTQETANFINISSIALLPLLVLLVGGVIWWRRR